MAQWEGPGGFFDRQANARRRTRLYLLYFPLTLLFIFLVVNVAYFLSTILTMEWVLLENAETTPYRPERILLVNLAGLAVVAAAIVYKARQLAAGGWVVAEMLGGTPVASGDGDPALRRLVNVVEEMAVASGLPVPGIYVLEKVNGINAFAAGLTPSDAVVAVTRGALDYLDRDELQGVVAHEVAHVVNGDARLNMRMMALLFGIQVISLIGGRLADPDYGKAEARIFHGRGAPAISMLTWIGFLLWFLGYVGLFFGRVVQSAISRQREHLADASAIQFTRNPLGLARALMKIGGLSYGSQVRGAVADGASHLFFGAVRKRSFLWWTASHPPLPERIRLLDPTFDGQFPKLSGGKWHGLPGSAAVASPAPPSSRAPLERASALLAALPATVLAAVHAPHASREMVLALLLAPDGVAREKQVARLREEEGEEALGRILDRARELTALPREVLPTLADLLFPAMRGLPPGERERLAATVDFLARADGKVTLLEYALGKLLTRNLLPERLESRGVAHPIYSFRKVAAELTLVVAAAARLGRGEGAEEAFRAGMALFGGAFPYTFPDAAACSLKEVDRALATLGQLGNEFKGTLVAALAAAGRGAAGAGKMRVGWYMRAVCAVLDAPVPDAEEA